MSWNNGYERRKFEQAQKAQAKEYRKCGMNEEQIRAMYLQDLQEYRNNRIYAIHIQSIEELESDGEESRNTLHKKFLLSMTCTMDTLVYRRSTKHSFQLSVTSLTGISQFWRQDLTGL